MHELDAQTFFRQWLSMLDALVPIDEYRQFLPDGDFEEWSYPDMAIRNVNELEDFYKKTWGAISRQSNKIKSLSVTPAQQGRFAVTAEVEWEAVTATGQSMARTLRYSMTVGSGRSTLDPEGKQPKIFRYKIERI